VGAAVVARQQEGRRIALTVLCGGLRGVSDAGAATLKGMLINAPGQKATKQELQLRQAAAKAYARIVARGVVDQAHVKASQVLDRSGRLNCEKVQRLARVGARGP
jgi:hypothetical protein